MIIGGHIVYTILPYHISAIHLAYVRLTQTEADSKIYRQHCNRSDTQSP